mgnify:CR=1 FL=1
MSKLVPPVAITLDRERHLVCDMAAIELINEWSGVDLMDAESMKDNPRAMASPRVINAILAALLTVEDPGMKPSLAGRLIDSKEKLEAATKAVGESIARFFGVSAEDLEAMSQTPDHPQANP